MALSVFIHARFIIFREGKSNAHLNGDYQRIGDIMVNSFLTVLEVSTYISSLWAVSWLGIWNNHILLPVVSFIESCTPDWGFCCFHPYEKILAQRPRTNPWEG